MEREVAEVLLRQEIKLEEFENRLKLLEFVRKNPAHINPEIAIAEAAARAQAICTEATSSFQFPRKSTGMWYDHDAFRDTDPFISRRADATAILAMSAFIRRLLDREDLAHAVTDEVRAAARKALDLP